MEVNQSISTISPAKINLMLRILGQREDGYHNLQTLFHLLNWGDEMVFTPASDQTIEITGDFQNLKTTDNLIHKAMMALKPYQKNHCGIQVHVSKKIPQGSGLGGGSSNAATTLRVMNDIWNCQLPVDELIKKGVRLGADVPIFLLNKPALAEGIGERLTPYPLPKYWVVLIFPPVSVSTVSVFKSNDLQRSQQRVSRNLLLQTKNWINACTEVVLKKHPEIQKCYEIASQHSKVYMSGTGSTLFSLFSKEMEAEEFQNQIKGSLKTQLCESF